MTLEKHHIEQLQSSAISPEIIAERGYRSITNKSELAGLGFSSSQQRVPGLLIPQWGVDGKETGYQYRPDNPRTNGKHKAIKYENPTGGSIRLDCPPRCQKMLGDPSIPLWITEGSKKADALASHGACAISLTGVWGFKGKNELGGITMLADWDYIALKERLVYLAFDSDIVDKSAVKKALQRMAQHLETRAVIVKIVRLPSSNGAKVGIDDYLAAGHTLADAEALSEAHEADVEEQTIRRPYFYYDGRLYLQVKMVDGKMAFAYLDGGKVKYAEALPIGNGRNVVPQFLPKGEDSVELDLVGLPDEGIAATALLNSAELFERIKGYIKRYVDLDPLDLELCCYYSLFTWFYRKVNTLGYLRFIADTGKGKTRAQKVVGDLCFYPFHTSGASSFSGMARTSQHWRGTLIMDEADMDGDMASQVIKFLNLGFERGQYYVLSDKQNPRLQQYFDPFMTKILAMRKPFPDNATEGRLLSITTYETTNLDIPILLPPEYPAEVETLRNTIARFVLEYWDKVDGSKMTDFRHLPIEPRLKQLAMPLSIIFQVWPDGVEQFEDYLLARQRELRRARSTSWEGTLFNLVYSIAVGDIDLKDSFLEYYSQGGNIEAITPTMIAKQMSSKPKSITQGLTSIGFEVESRRLPSGNKKPRLYCVPDARKWREVVSRYYYSEDDAPPAEAPEVLRGSKYIVFPEPSQVSQVSPPLTKPAAPKETGTDGTDGTLTGTRNNGYDDTTGMPDYPTKPCFNCKGIAFWPDFKNKRWICSRCHPKPEANNV
ncbi:MAG: DUF3854 domain-containing protein [Chloroflexi bacterium]|nr:DUF3854 domain-containing protein [Chloroflexota bacterium]